MIPVLLKNVITSQFVIFLPLAFLMKYFHDDNNHFGIKVERELPSLMEMGRHVLVFLVCEEVMFFYSHWLLHHPSIYAYIHKIHHQFTAPIALAAIYAHPIEVIFSNIVPLLTGPILCRAHVVTYILWACVGIITTETHHSGYRMPWTPPFDHQPNFHDYHHEYFNRGNYGLLGVMDYLHGTDKHWRASAHKVSSH
jgi:methylsterol monooxygenase